ncbi:MAG: nuclear transport factor 2 family protein [Caulobacteraceae bacterium]|nr:nuclear transport factor 2 family protein [Caulobacteraceae bacterium]
MADHESTVRELKDRQDIYDCLVRYCRGMDRFDRALLRSAYHADALDDHGEFVGGVEGFIDYYFAYHTKYQHRTVHSLSNHTCELDGDTAHCETYWTFTALNKNPPLRTQGTGRYIDRLEKRDGKWGIAARICVIDGTTDDSDPERAAGRLNFLPTSRDKSDPSYMRPLAIDPARINNRPAHLA